MTGRAAILVPTAAAIALGGLILAGCGDAGGAENGAPVVSRAYVKVVTGLRDAALSKTPYDATRRAKRLAKPERAVIEGFCEFAWQIPVNHLVYLLAERTYSVDRITHLSELSYRGGAVDYDVEDASVEASLGKLRSIVGLGSLDGDLVRRYSRACNR